MIGLVWNAPMFLTTNAIYDPPAVSAFKKMANIFFEKGFFGNHEDRKEAKEGGGKKVFLVFSPSDGGCLFLMCPCPENPFSFLCGKRRRGTRFPRSVLLPLSSSSSVEDDPLPRTPQPNQPIPIPTRSQDHLIRVVTFREECEIRQIF